MNQVVINESWKNTLKDEFEKEYFTKLTQKIRAEYLSQAVFPPPKNIFEAFNLCPFDNVKVVIIGQDPYHGKGQANGLAFAVSDNIPIPPSLKNIFKEIESDLGVKTKNNGNLERWAKQGVLLLNSVLTVRSGFPASHKNLGWEKFTDAVVFELNKKKSHLVYFLWGNYAKQKGARIDRVNNLVLESAHPSPFSVAGFLNNHHFSQCNIYLLKHNMQEIDWR